MTQPAAPNAHDDIKQPERPKLLQVLGPGLITGASDDDPSGIATYSQAGAQFGFGLSWVMLFSWPLMCAIQEISARIGRVTGRGIAYCKYELARTYIAAVAEVEVKRSSGDIRVTKFYLAHDCGQIINPDGLKNQLDGNVIQTISRTLKEELTFDRSMVTSLDWASYPILTFPELPELVIDLIDRPTEKPWGAGEPSAATIPAAISNAIFDATGARIRSVPFKREKVKAALQSV